MSLTTMDEFSRTSRKMFNRDRNFYQLIVDSVKSKKKTRKDDEISESSSSSDSRAFKEKIYLIFKGFSSNRRASLDSLLIKTQTIGFSQLIFAFYLISCLGKWAEKEIFCIRQFDVTPPDDEEEDICLQYSYTESKNGVRYYILFYKWFHIGLSFLSAYYFLLHLVLKYNSISPLDDVIYKKKKKPGLTINDIKTYWEKYVGAHNSIYFKKISLHVLALVLNLFGMFILDLIVQGKYKTLPLFLFITRDIEFFDDEMSYIFPPFVKCEITPAHQLWLERTERFGCHFTHMIIYEKIMFIIWFCQLFLAIWSLCYILIMLLPLFSRHFKKYLIVQGFYRHTKLTNRLCKKLTVSDCYAFGLTTDFLVTEEFVEMQLFVLDECDKLDM